MAIHLVATTRGRDRSLLRWERASWLWQRLREGLPQALSCVLMLDHLHLVTPPGLERRFRRILTAFTARFGVRFDVLEPEVANSAAIAGRMIRYGLFNPVRAGLVDDPWRWPWSTLRDLGGVAFPIWTRLSVLASLLGIGPAAALRCLTTLGDHRPPLPMPGNVAVATIDSTRAAVVAALRARDREIVSSATGRRLIVQSCYAIGSPCSHRLAAELGCSERTVRRARAPRHPAVDAVLCCLADARLRGV